MTTGAATTDAEIEELVSHVFALRKDFVQELLKSAEIPYSRGSKAELRERLHEAIAQKKIGPARIAGFLDEKEPGGKQHVFLMRPASKLNKEWRDAAAVRRRLRRRRDLRQLLDGSIPLIMPAELELSQIRLVPPLVEIVGVEARRYFERDELYDQEAVSDDGFKIHLRAHIERVARSTVVLRWNTATRHAALHITQASGRGLERDHYGNVAARFANVVDPWLDFTEFRKVKLAKAIHELQRRERAKHEALTKSRRAKWETPDGSEIEAVSASSESSVYVDTTLSEAVGHVEGPTSGQSANFHWHPTSNNSIAEPLHVAILAFDSRVHFMRPSSPESVQHVIEQIRRLL